MLVVLAGVGVASDVSLMLWSVPALAGVSLLEQREGREWY